MKENMNEFIEEIECVSPDQTAILFKNQKLDKQLVLIAVNGIHQRIAIFDALAEMKEVATIIYSNRRNKTFISSFEVDENYQQNGIGRLLFEIALTHADILDITMLYGDAEPINNIKDVSNIEGKTFEDEQNTLIKIYQKLGCTINPIDNRFVQKWKSGEKIKQASSLVSKVAYLLAEKDVYSKDQNQPQ